jgi:SAM-dependent MidA family methyltransferase
MDGAVQGGGMSRGRQPGTPLARKLEQRIRREGPLPLVEYMRACLADPEHGYYRTRAALGAGGDFITAPEISQVFGELIGLWSAVVWQRMGAPKLVALVELGPGRGSLMKDALRAARAVPDFLAAVRVELIEVSETLRLEQEAALKDAAVPVAWARDIADVPKEVPAIVIANEFLDALPVAQWERRGNAWHARTVGLSGAGAFELVTGGASAEAETLAAHYPPASEGAILEVKETEALVHALGSIARAAPLSAIFIDYGHAGRSFGDTLQAVRGQRYEDIFAAPGEADLSTQVSFADFAEQLRDAELAVDGPVTQAELLGSLGIAERASALMAANPGRAASIETAIARLMTPNGMGTRCKAIGIRSKTLPELPGLIPAAGGPR